MTKVPNAMAKRAPRASTLAASSASHEGDASIDSIEAALAPLDASAAAGTSEDGMGPRRLPNFDEGDIAALLDELFADELDVNWRGAASADAADAADEDRPDQTSTSAPPPGLGATRRSGRRAA